MNLPNKITMARFVLVFGFFIFLFFDVKYKYIIAAVAFVAIALTDIVDGHLARKRKMVTDFGKFADPLADKLLVTVALLYFITILPQYWWMVFLIITREFAVTGLRAVAAVKRMVMPADWAGKVKMFLQVVTIVIIFIDLQYNAFDRLPYVMMLFTTLVTVFSGILYFFKAKDIIKKSSC